MFDIILNKINIEFKCIYSLCIIYISIFISMKLNILFRITIISPIRIMQTALSITEMRASAMPPDREWNKMPCPWLKALITLPEV